MKTTHFHGLVLRTCNDPRFLPSCHARTKVATVTTARPTARKLIVPASVRMAPTIRVIAQSDNSAIEIAAMTRWFQIIFTSSPIRVWAHKDGTYAVRHTTPLKRPVIVKAFFVATRLFSAAKAAPARCRPCGNRLRVKGLKMVSKTDSRHSNVFAG